MANNGGPDGRLDRELGAVVGERAGGLGGVGSSGVAAVGVKGGSNGDQFTAHVCARQRI
jgi:hypothetical protein